MPIRNKNSLDLDFNKIIRLLSHQINTKKTQQPQPPKKSLHQKQQPQQQQPQQQQPQQQQPQQQQPQQQQPQQQQPQQQQPQQQPPQQQSVREKMSIKQQQQQQSSVKERLLAKQANVANTHVEFQNLIELVKQPKSLADHTEAVKHIRKFLDKKPKTLQFLTTPFQSKYNYRRTHLLVLTHFLLSHTDDEIVVCLAAFTGWKTNHVPAQFNQNEWNSILKNAALDGSFNYNDVIAEYTSIIKNALRQFNAIDHTQFAAKEIPFIFKIDSPRTDDNKIFINKNDSYKEIIKFIL